jgi:hypothetical protein
VLLVADIGDEASGFWGGRPLTGWIIIGRLIDRGDESGGLAHVEALGSRDPLDFVLP